jgi:hypothetical protein
MTDLPTRIEAGEALKPPMVGDLANALIALEQEAWRIGMPKTARQIALALQEVGWEGAALMKGRKRQTRREAKVRKGLKWPKVSDA